jgi:deoxyribonuclease-4
LAKGGLTILIENTAGAESSLGGSFEQVAEVLERLRDIVPIAACIDTCHTHVAGYDIVSEEGLYGTLQRLDQTVGLNHVKVWHCNDAKAARGSKLDRHQHVGKGTIGKETFRILLNDLRLAHAAFIAETPIDKPGDDRRNVDALKKLVSDDDGGHPTVTSEALPSSPERVMLNMFNKHARHTTRTRTGRETGVPG